MSSIRVSVRALGRASVKTWILGTPRSFSRRRGGLNGTGAKDNGKEFFNDISNCFISVFNNIYF